MNVRTAIRRIKKFRPTTPEEFRAAGVPLGGFVGAGVFRETFRIKDCDLVVKFPLNDGSKDPYRDGKNHTAVELRKLARLAQYPYMRKYLPKIYYHDKKSGVLVLRYYPNFECQSDHIESLGKLIQELVYRQTGINLYDVHEGNVLDGGSGAESRAILVDIGY